LGNQVLATGTVNNSSFFDEAHPFTYTGTSLAISAGDQLSLVVARSNGQQYGSFAGVNLNVADPVPEPGTGLVAAVGGLLITLGALRRKL
jgi:hypothetical protein